MALEDLTPVTRTEAILDGDDISPVTRMEYFLGKAANEVPKPDGVSDAGKVLTVNAAGDGFELDTPASGLPAYTGADLGKVLTVVEGSETETVVVVPEQTVTVVEGQDLPTLHNVIASGFVAGNTGIISVNGVDYEATATDTPQGIYFGNFEAAMVVYSPSIGETEAHLFADPGTYTIKLTANVHSVEPKWEDLAVPDIPTENGSYYLKIDDGVASWESTIQ